MKHTALSLRQMLIHAGATVDIHIPHKIFNTVSEAFVGQVWYRDEGSYIDKWSVEIDQDMMQALADMLNGDTYAGEL